MKKGKRPKHTGATSTNPLKQATSGHQTLEETYPQDFFFFGFTGKGAGCGEVEDLLTSTTPSLD